LLWLLNVVLMSVNAWIAGRRLLSNLVLTQSRWKQSSQACAPSFCHRQSKREACEDQFFFHSYLKSYMQTSLFHIRSSWLGQHWLDLLEACSLLQSSRASLLLDCLLQKLGAQAWLGCFPLDWVSAKFETKRRPAIHAFTDMRTTLSSQSKAFKVNYNHKIARHCHDPFLFYHGSWLNHASYTLILYWNITRSTHILALMHSERSSEHL
jgi:hypothetical protein